MLASELHLIQGVRDQYRATVRTASRRSWRLSLLLHAILLAGVLWTLIRAFQAWTALGDVSAAASPTEIAPVDWVEVVEAPPTPGVPAAVDRSVSQKILKESTQARPELSPAQAMALLQSLLGPAAKISDTEMDRIGEHLGNKRGAYEPRTDYRNEVNPNLNMIRARIIRASAAADDDGALRYTLEFKDREDDRLTVDLTGRPARELHTARPVFAGNPLLPHADGAETFELKGAGVANIRRWKREGDTAGMKGMRVDLQDPAGRKVTLHITGNALPPFRIEYGRFFRWRTVPGFDPDDDTTAYGQYFDHNNATMHKVTPAKPGPNGETRARVVMVDHKGERMIYYVTGKDAEDLLERTRVLQENKTVKRLYDRVFKGKIPQQLKEYEQNNAKQK